MNKPKIIFSKDTTKFILNALGYDTDAEGYVVRGDERIRDKYYDEEIHIDEIGGISKDGFIKNDLQSIMNLVEENGTEIVEDENGSN